MLKAEDAFRRCSLAVGAMALYLSALLPGCIERPKVVTITVADAADALKGLDSRGVRGDAETDRVDEAFDIPDAREATAETYPADKGPDSQDTPDAKTDTQATDAGPDAPDLSDAKTDLQPADVAPDTPDLSDAETDLQPADVAPDAPDLSDVQTDLQPADVGPDIPCKVVLRTNAVDDYDGSCTSGNCPEDDGLWIAYDVDNDGKLDALGPVGQGAGWANDGYILELPGGWYLRKCEKNDYGNGGVLFCGVSSSPNSSGAMLYGSKTLGCLPPDSCPPAVEVQYAETASEPTEPYTSNGQEICVHVCESTYAAAIPDDAPETVETSNSGTCPFPQTFSATPGVEAESDEQDGTPPYHWRFSEGDYISQQFDFADSGAAAVEKLETTIKQRGSAFEGVSYAYGHWEVLASDWGGTYTIEASPKEFFDLAPGWPEHTWSLSPAGLAELNSLLPGLESVEVRVHGDCDWNQPWCTQLWVKAMKIDLSAELD